MIPNLVDWVSQEGSAGYAATSLDTVAYASNIMPFMSLLVTGSYILTRKELDTIRNL